MGQRLSKSRLRLKNTNVDEEPSTTDPPFIAQCEEFYEGGPEASDLFDECVKNPGHPTFIPVKDFDKRHLPLECRSGEVWEHIRECCDRTVRVVVKYTSLDRPDTFPNCTSPYPFCKFKGSSRKTRTGTGFLKYEWVKPLDSPIMITCPCRLCRSSGDQCPKKEFHQFVVSTATHVVFDDSEAERTVFELFYDDDDDKDQVRFLYGVRLLNERGQHRRCVEDRVDVLCVVHDDGQDNIDLLRRLPSFQKLTSAHPSFEIPITHFPSYEDLTTPRPSYENMIPPTPSFRNLMNTRPSFDNLNELHTVSDTDIQSFGILISHPHGKSKHITLGQFIKRIAPLPADYTGPGSSEELRRHSWFKRNFIASRRNSRKIVRKTKYIKYDFCPEFAFGCRQSADVPDPPEELCKLWPKKEQNDGKQVVFQLRRNVTFSVPSDAPYLCHSVTFGEGFYKFPPGTKISRKGLNKSFVLPEVEFSLYPGHTWKFYNMDTCPGCSGAPVVKTNAIFPGISHSGALKDGTNRSALYQH